LSAEDNKFYQLHLSSHGYTGYSKAKAVPIASIHPSQWAEEDSVVCLSPRRSTRHCTESDVKLVTKAHLSTSNASRVLNILKDVGYSVPFSSQSGIQKAVYKEAELIAQHFETVLKNYELSLHFNRKN
jgi:hypothetical protein